MRKSSLLFIYLLISLSQIFSSGQQESTINDSYFCDYSKDLSTSIIYNAGTSEDCKIHEISFSIEFKYFSEQIIDVINMITVNSSILSEDLVINQNDLSTYSYDSNELDTNDGYIFSVCEVDFNKLSVQIFKKPMTASRGTFASDEIININIDFDNNDLAYHLFLEGKNNELEPINSILDNDSELRLSIVPDVEIYFPIYNEELVGNLPENTFFKDQYVCINSKVYSPRASLLDIKWDYGGIEVYNTENRSKSMNLDRTGRYTIHVDVEDDLGNKGSDQIDIHVIDNMFPTKPELLYPLKDDLFNAEEDLFCWKLSSDPEGEKITYKIEISESPEFNSIINSNDQGRYISVTSIISLAISFFFISKRKNYIKSILLIIIGFVIACCTYPIESKFFYPDDSLTYMYQNLDSDTTYYWRVIAIDEMYNESISEEIEFRTK